MTDAPPSIAVCDAGPLIHLDELGCLSLLDDFSAVLVPESVWIEAEKHRPDFAQKTSRPFERLQPSGERPFAIESLARLLALHPGEIDALHVAQARPGSILLSDDTAARVAALHLQLTVHGTIGILLRAIRRHQRSAPEIAALLRELPRRSSLHIKRELLREIIVQVEAIK